MYFRTDCSDRSQFLNILKNIPAIKPGYETYEVRKDHKRRTLNISIHEKKLSFFDRIKKSSTEKKFEKEISLFLLKNKPLIHQNHLSQSDKKLTIKALEEFKKKFSAVFIPQSPLIQTIDRLKDEILDSKDHKEDESEAGSKNSSRDTTNLTSQKKRAKKPSLFPSYKKWEKIAVIAVGIFSVFNTLTKFNHKNFPSVSTTNLLSSGFLTPDTYQRIYNRALFNKKDSFTFQDTLIENTFNGFDKLDYQCPSPDINFNLKKDASLAFALLNTDFASYELYKYPLLPINALRVMSRLLEVNQDKIGDKKNLEKFIQKIHKSYAIESIFESVEKRCNSIEEFNAIQHIFYQKFADYLEKGKPLYLASGWHGTIGNPGHHILLELTPHRTQQGKTTVSGKILNTGSGLGKHKFFVKGLQNVFDSEIQLEQTTLKNLFRSSFFSHYLQLKFSQNPLNQKSMLFSENDFYDAFLTSWPGNINHSKNPTPRIAQRGPTCTIQPLISDMLNSLSPKAGKLAKFYITLSSWHHFVDSGGINEENFFQVETLLPKLARRAIKLKKAHLLSEKNLLDVNRFSQKVKQVITEVKAKYHQKLHLHSEDFNTPTNSTHFSFTIPETSSYEDEITPIKDKSFTLNTLDLTWINGYIKSQIRLMEHQPTRVAKMIALYTIRALPNPSDPIWLSVTNCDDTQIREDILVSVYRARRFLIKGLVSSKEKINITPQQACMWVKSLGIIYRLGQESLPQDLYLMYASGLRDLVYEFLPALFSPLNPGDLEGYQDTVNFIQQSLKKYDEKSFFTPHPINHYTTTYFSRKFVNFESEIKDPELSYLYNISKKHPSWIDKTEDVNLNKKQAIAKAYSSDNHSYDLLIYKIIRESLFSCHLILNFRGKLPSSKYTPEIIFSAEVTSDKKDLVFDVHFRNVIPKDSLKYNKGVFADAFAGLNSDTKHATEDFITELLGRKYTSTTTHNHLGLIQEPKVIDLDDKHSYSINPLYLQDIISSRTKSSLPLVQIEHFFSQNLVQLKEPFFQSLFTTLLFKAEKDSFEPPLKVALKKLEKTKEMDSFLSFLTLSLEQTRKAKLWPSYLFLLRTSAISASHLCYYQETHPINQRFVSQFKQELKDVGSDIVTMTFLDQSALSNKLLSLIPYLYNNHQTLPLIDQILNLHEILNILTIDKKTIDDFHLNEDIAYGNFLLNHDPILSKKIPIRDAKLPDKIRFSHLYKRLFSISYPVKEVSPNLYEFSDEKEILYRVYHAYDGIRILRLFKEENGDLSWYAFSENNPFTKNPSCSDHHPCGEHGYLQRRTRFWLKVGEKKAIATQEDNNQLVCIISEKNIHHPQNKKLILLENYDHPIIQTLSKISPLEEILAWQDIDSKQVLKIELKEFDLEFNVDIDNKKVKSSKYFGFYIDTHQKNRSFHPIPQYLVLTNDQGQQKVICPSRRYFQQKTVFSSRNNPVVQHNSRDYIKKIFSYNIASNGLVELPEDPEALLYLSYLALERQDYQLGFKAAKKQLKQPVEWNKSMGILIYYFQEPITSSEEDKTNYHPQASALRLKLRAALVSEFSDRTMDIKLFDSFQKDYINYLNQLNNIQKDHRLEKEEEIRLYRLTSRTSKHPSHKVILNNRYFSLFGENNLFAVSPTYPIHRPPVNHFKAVSFDWINQSICKKMLEAVENPTPIIFTMRSKESFLENFLYYYKILRHHTKDSLFTSSIEKIKSHLKASMHYQDGDVQGARKILLIVLSHPEITPSYKELLQIPEEIEEFYRKYGLDIIYPKFLPKKLSTLLTAYRKHPKELTSFNKKIYKTPIDKIEQLPYEKTLEKTSAKTQVKYTASFEGNPDTIIESFLAKEIVFQAPPGKEVIKELHSNLKHLQELELFYEEKAKRIQSTTKREFIRLLKGVKELIKKVKIKSSKIQLAIKSNDISTLDLEETIHLIDDQIETAVIEIEKIKKQELLHLFQLEKNIKEHLNDYSKELELEVHADLLVPLSVNEAIIHFGRGNDQAFYQSNPGLTLVRFKEIKNLIGDYLVQKQNYQKSMRSLKSLKKLNNIRLNKGVDSIDYRIAKKKAIQTFSAKRMYKADQAPHLLVFETFANIYLRKEQILALEALTKDQKDVIFEARTGFGKSKALIPLWLHLTSKTNQEKEIPSLSMMTVPASLYEQQLSYLKKVLGGSFDQSVFAFKFDRKKGSYLSHLKKMNRKLDIAAEKGMCVLTTVNSLHSLVNLKLKEILSLEHSRDNRLLIRELRKLRYKLKHNLSNFFDESRESFDIRRYFDYAIGAPKSISHNHIKALEQIYDTLLKLDLKIPFDFLPNSQASFIEDALTEERYHSEIKKVLARKLLDNLIDTNTIKKPDQKGYLLILDHLMGSYHSDVNDYLSRIPENKQRLYAIYREQLNIYLPRTLTRPCNGRYGLVSSKTHNRFAYPFERGVAKLSSQFSTIDDLLDFTIQGNLKTPFALKDIAIFIETLKIQIENVEDFDYFRRTDHAYLGYLAITKEIENWPAHIQLCGKKEIETLTSILNNPKYIHLKLKFITTHILPQITTYTKKISSTAHNLVESMESTFGASGTINADTLSPKLSTIENLSTPIGSILSIWKNSQEAIFTLKTKSAFEMLASAIQKHPDYRVIIDVASTFRDFRKEDEIARVVFDETAHLTPAVEAFSYYDDSGKNLVFLRPKPGGKLQEPILRKYCTTPLENTFIFMRQSATIGADTPMAMNAKALVTVSSDTQRDLFLQGIGRMRGILTGQKVGFLIQDKDTEAFKEGTKTISLRNILSIVSQNQGEQRGLDLFFNLRLLLQNLIEKQFWEFVDDRQYNEKQCTSLFHTLEHFFVENTMKDPLLSLTQSREVIPIKEAVAQIRAYFIEKLSLILKEGSIDSDIISLKWTIEQFDSLIDFDKLPTEIKTNVSEEFESIFEAEALESDVVEEIDLDIGFIEEAGNDEESEKEKMAMSELPLILYTPAKPLHSKPYQTLGIEENSLVKHHFNSKFSKIFKNIYGSTNFFHINAEGKRPEGILKTAYQSLIIHENGDFKVVLMDQKDAKSALEEMIEKSDCTDDKDFYLVSSTGRVLAKNAKKELDRTALDKHPNLTLLTKVFSRQMDFTKKEIFYLSSLEPDLLKIYFDFFNEEISYCWPPVAPILEKLQDRVKEEKS